MSSVASTTARAIVVTARHQAELQTIDFPAAPAADPLTAPTVCTLMSPGTELAWYYSGAHAPGHIQVDGLLAHHDPAAALFSIFDWQG